MKRQTNYILQVRLTTPFEACIPAGPGGKSLPYPHLPFQVAWFYEVPSEVIRCKQCHVFLQLNDWLTDATQQLQLLVKGPVKTLKAFEVLTYVETLTPAEPVYLSLPQGCPSAAATSSASSSQKQTEQLKQYKFEILAEATPPASQSIPRFDGTKTIGKMDRATTHHIDSDDDAEKSNPLWTTSNDDDDNTQDGVLWQPINEDASRTLRDVNASAADVLAAITSIVTPLVRTDHETFTNETHILTRLGSNK